MARSTEKKQEHEGSCQDQGGKLYFIVFLFQRAARGTGQLSPCSQSTELVGGEGCQAKKSLHNEERGKRKSKKGKEGICVFFIS